MGAEAAETDGVSEFVQGCGRFIGGIHLADGVIHGGSEDVVFVWVKAGDGAPISAGGFDDDGFEAGGGGLPAFVECEWDGPFFAGGVPGDGIVSAGVFNEIDGSIKAKGHELDEFVEGGRVEAAVEVDAEAEIGVAGGALAGFEETKGFAPIGVTFGFEGGPTFG